MVEFVRRFPPTFNTEHRPKLIRQFFARQQLSAADVTHFVFTQLNLRTLEATMAALAAPLGKTHWTMDTWGYTGSACITLDDPGC